MLVLLDPQNVLSPPDPVVSRLSLTSPIRGSMRGKCLRSHGSATKAGTTRVPAGHRPSSQVLPSAWQSLTSPKPGTANRIGEVRLRSTNREGSDWQGVSSYLPCPKPCGKTDFTHRECQMFVMLWNTRDL